MKKKILVLCTGNSARSQMAEGFLRSFDPTLEVISAGTFPAGQVNPLAVEVMKEVGIDLSSHHPKSVEEFLQQPFDYVITVCDNAKETCPIFTGTVKRRLHLGFPDPAEAVGSREEILSAFRFVRNNIQKTFRQFWNDSLKR
jgi:arsenate reductase